MILLEKEAKVIALGIIFNVAFDARVETDALAPAETCLEQLARLLTFFRLAQITRIGIAVLAAFNWGQQKFILFSKMLYNWVESLHNRNYSTKCLITNLVN